MRILYYERNKSATCFGHNFELMYKYEIPSFKMRGLKYILKYKDRKFYDEFECVHMFCIAIT